MQVANEGILVMTGYFGYFPNINCCNSRHSNVTLAGGTGSSGQRRKSHDNRLVKAGTSRTEVAQSRDILKLHLEGCVAK